MQLFQRNSQVVGKKCLHTPISMQLAGFRHEHRFSYAIVNIYAPLRANSLEYRTLIFAIFFATMSFTVHAFKITQCSVNIVAVALHVVKSVADSADSTFVYYEYCHLSWTCRTNDPTTPFTNLKFDPRKRRMLNDSSRYSLILRSFREICMR